MTTRRDESGDANVGVGRYRLISRIATGGMAEIYVARMEGARDADPPEEWPDRRVH